MRGTTHINKHQVKADINNYRLKKRKTIIHFLQVNNESREIHLQDQAAYGRAKTCNQKSCKLVPFSYGLPSSVKCQFQN